MVFRQRLLNNRVNLHDAFKENREFTHKGNELILFFILLFKSKEINHIA
ncbi:hypothetical protein M153_5050002478 [Pseudoloma neurophilia]|uniref:Uncharacterized protein n=1 Tax=Pseudoloma neurophilia TaxID=146866 RepID=A0A0R0LX31_9MICR|nr:hypothetical protein M153_5050002478 [Pseudoloma neurophilia]